MKLDLLNQSSKNTIIGGQTVSYGDNPHASPADFDLWWEPFATAPQPWMYFSGKWYSNVLLVQSNLSGVISSSFGTAQLQDIIPINHEYQGFDIFLRNVTFDANLTNGGHSGSANYSFPVRWYGTSTTGDFSSPATAALTTFSTSTMTANGIYRKTYNHNALLVNCRGFYITSTKTGSPAGFNCALSFSMRITRK
ncbi:MAG: hypothetical protein HC862_03030 [Scytonema sp. RU_4_4]|uniref:hypothetical protein n=1 Tax=Brasilonema sp. UFV-L1 TaxID=2234130 RepID=UPI00145CB536|nr:hypothetical protein [Brasilonema sp. UFV-L1]NJM69272.1 hypothetical protein [Scytonema sp. RU_4_4]NMG10471.1 hypothetical protein [Brasilonema sp. UFV-L1]